MQTGLLWSITFARMHVTSCGISRPPCSSLSSRLCHSRSIMPGIKNNVYITYYDTMTHHPGCLLCAQRRGLDFQIATMSSDLIKNYYPFTCTDWVLFTTSFHIIYPFRFIFRINTFYLSPARLVNQNDYLFIQILSLKYSNITFKPILVLYVTISP